MMATAEPLSSSSLLPLLESLEDSSAGQSEQTDAYLTIANRLSGDDGRQFLPAVEKHFSRLVKTILTHISSPNTELSQASLQALGFCLYHAHVARGVTAKSAEDILAALCSLVVKSTDKNTCIRALWVISKQSFPLQVVANKVSSILGTLENVWTREDIQSVVMEHEALNVIIRMLEQAPVQMSQSAVRWAKLIIPLVVHSASKVRLRAAAALELGLPLLLEKQNDVAGILEPLMSSKLIPELQKLFMSKNEANVLKLWPLFVKLLGKLLHKGGPFINSVLHLEEMGFRHSSPTIKKIAFIAWKSLIDNFALNPDILSNTKRMKLLMQPLNIHLRTEALQLTKVEVWWYLVVRLGPNLGPNFEQVSVPLLQCTIGADSATVPSTPVRGSNQNSAVTPIPPKTGPVSFNSPASSTPRLSVSLNASSSSAATQTFPSIQLLGVEMLLHYFLGPEVVPMAARNKLVLSLEPLTHPFISGISSFTKNAAVFISNVRDGFIAVGKDAPESLLTLIWKRLVSLVNSTIESVGNKKDRQACEVLTLMFQALQSIVSSEALPADKVLALFEITVKGIPQRILGSASYQVGKMDVLNGTPALYLIFLLYNSSLLSAYIEHERFFECLHALVGCGLSGPTSPLAFVEAVLGAMGRSAGSLENKEQLWKMWSTVVSPLTDTITQTNEVNQGDALEHNFSAMHCALMLPVTHLLSGTPPLLQNTQKLMLSMWSKLYKAFARCSALVATAEENICCEELCKKMGSAVDSRALANPYTLDAVASILQVIIECVDFSPYTPQFQPIKKSPHTPLQWRTNKKNKALGNLYTYQALLVQSLEAFLVLEGPEAAASESTGAALVSIVSTLFTNLALASTIQEALASLNQPLTLFYKQASCELPKFSSGLMSKLEKLIGEVLGCLQTRSALAFEDDLLALLSPLFCVLFPHKSKQLRTSVTQFWNATFAKSASLKYPEELRPILCQVKHNTPIILPGFEANSLDSDELSGQYSSQSSQLETKLSGVKVSSAVQRGSLLGRAAEQDRTSMKSKPVSQTKLDFGSPKPPFRKDLDEEASIDFVFIPPETKEARVLTEHQKEMKRTKRGDIPAMYNNLDASLDTTVFTQYTQSQEESMDKLQTDVVDSVAKEAPGKVHDEEMEKGESTDNITEETQEYASHEITDMAEVAVNDKQETSEDIVPDSADVSVEEVNSNVVAEGLDTTPKSTSPNVSGSSDLISDTPQKSNSRRQSFITLEKYASQESASPVNVTKFTGPLTKTSNNPEATTTSISSSLPSPAATGTDPQVPEETGETRQQSPVDIPPVSSKLSEGNFSEVKLSDKPHSEGTEDEEDVIPDTQTERNNEKKASESDSSREDSQSSQVEPRRSGRALKPKHPGEDGEKQQRRRRKGEDSQGDSQNASLNDSQSHGTRSRSKQEEIGKLRTRGQKNAAESSQTDSQPSTRKRITLYSSSKELLGEDMPKRRSSRKHEKSQSESDTPPSSSESQEKRRPGRPSKSAVETEEAGRLNRRTGDQKDSSQMDPHVATKTKREEEEIETSLNNSQMTTPSQADSQSTARTSRRSKLVEALGGLMNAKRMRSSAAGDELSGDDSEVLTPSVTDSQSQHGPRRQTKATSEVAVPKLKDESVDSLESENSNTHSQSTPTAVSQPRPRGRPKKGEGSQSLEAAGSAESSRGRYSTRRSSQALLANKENSELDSSEIREDTLMAKQQSKKSKDSLPISPTCDSSEYKVALDVGSGSSQSLKESEPQNTPPCSILETKSLEDLPNSPNMQVSRPPLVTKNVEEQRDEVKETEMAVEVGAIIATEPVVLVEKMETEDAYKSAPGKPVSSHKRDHEQSPLQVKPNLDDASIQESNVRESQVPDNLESGGITSEQSSDLPVLPLQKNSHSDTIVSTGLLSDSPVSTEQSSLSTSPVTSASPPADTLISSGETDKLSLRVSQSSEEKDRETVHPVEAVTEDRVENAEVEDLNSAEDKEDVDANGSCTGQDQPECPSALDELPEDEEQFTAIKESQSELQVEHIEPLRKSIGEDDVQSELLVQHIEPLRESIGKDDVQSELQVQHIEPLQESIGKDDVQLELQVQHIEPLQESIGKDDVQSALQVQHIEPLQESIRKDYDEQEEETQIDHSDTDAVDLDLVAALTDGSVPSVSTCKEMYQDSPAKQKGLEAVNGLEAIESPSSRKARGTWSPSASPSTSILKKGQKRPMEEDTPSPLVKSRRVSFANPIQHQELADDIDRRSPVIRTSSPKRSKTTSSITHHKYVTTPTKGLLLLSPRNLHSPGYKSSKKCLISEMSQEPRPIPKDCVYPALVACSAPVEAVLPQITSNMWPRGFGQLVRARNIKTVGDLSALTPSEIKTLPIRSPKISNVKKALKTYHEQQRKGQGGDELKSFDETEKMTSEAETNSPQNQEEDDKSPGEPLATELVEEPMSEDLKPDEDKSTALIDDDRPIDQLNHDGRPVDLGALVSKVIPQDLSHCSDEQLVHLQDQMVHLQDQLFHLQNQLSGKMRSVVREQQARLHQRCSNA